MRNRWRALEWGIKDSLLTYIENVAGEVVCEGAARTEDGFWFPDKQTGGLQFDGSVTFLAHEGVLRVMIMRPAITFESGRCFLTVESTTGRISIAEVLDWPADGSSSDSTPVLLSDVALTVAGSQLLGDIYAPWQRMAPISLHP